MRSSRAGGCYGVKRSASTPIWVRLLSLRAHTAQHVLHAAVRSPPERGHGSSPEGNGARVVVGRVRDRISLRVPIEVSMGESRSRARLEALMHRRGMHLRKVVSSGVLGLAALLL